MALLFRASLKNPVSLMEGGILWRPRSLGMLLSSEHGKLTLRETSFSGAFTALILVSDEIFTRCSYASNNFSTVMAKNAKLTIVEVRSLPLLFRRGKTELVLGGVHRTPGQALTQRYSRPRNLR